MSDRHKLTWSSASAISQRPLPDGVKREFISSPDGPLELLVCLPRGETAAGGPPLLFVHGGFGTATAYMNFLPFFAGHGFPSYSVSLRGHGASHNPGFWRMFFTTKHTLALDIVTAVEHICAAHNLATNPSPSPAPPASSIVLIGHSSGGGLAQYILARNLAPAVDRIAALAAVPGFGSTDVYWNWMCMDPWFVPRMCLRDWMHPRSPLSSTALVHRAFFSDAFPSELVRAVEEEMPETESVAWPVGMLAGFVAPEKVLWGGRRVLVVAGGEDRIVGVGIMERLAAWLRGAVEGGEKEKGEMVRFEVVEGSGHDLMRDLKWEECARVVLGWLEGR